MNTPTTSAIRSTLIAGSLLLTLPLPSSAQTVWTGSTDFMWSVGSNWNPAGEPGAGTDVRLDDTGVVGALVLGTGELANSLSLWDAYSLTGGDLTLTAGSIEVGSLGAVVTLASQLSGTAGLTKTGLGKLILTNSSNNFTGPVTIANGSIQITDPAQLGGDSSDIVVSEINPTIGNGATIGFSGGSLVLDGSASGITFSRGLSLQGSGPLGGRGGALVSFGTNTLTEPVNMAAGVTPRNTRIFSINGTLEFTDSLNVSGTAGSTINSLGAINSAGPNNSFVISGPLTGTGTLEKSGAGTLVLTPSDTSGFSGRLRVSGSAVSGQSSVRVFSNDVFGTANGTNASAPIDMNGGVLEIRLDGDLNIGKNVYNRASSTYFAGPSIGGEGVNGIITFGTLRAAANTTATFNGRNGYGFTFTTQSLESNNNNSTFTNNGGPVTFTGNFWNNTNTTNRTLSLGGNGNTTILGNINASGANHILTKTGTGILTIAGTGTTLPGVININGGTLAVRDFRSITNNSARINIGTGGTTTNLFIGLDGFAPSASGLITDKEINLAGSTGGAVIKANQPGTAPVVLNTNFAATGGNSTQAKTLTLGGINAEDNLIAGIIPNNAAGGTVSLAKVDAGTWVLGGANTFSGNVTVANGTLKVRANAESSSVLNDLSDLVFDQNNGFAGGRFEFVGRDGENNVETLDILDVNNGANTLALTAGVGGTASLVFGSLAVPTDTSTLNILGLGAGNTITFTTPGTTGVAGTDPRIFINGTDIAFNDGGSLRTPVYGTDADFAAPTSTALTTTQANWVTGSFSNGAETIDTLKIDGGSTLTLTGNLVVRRAGNNTDGAILAVNGASLITGSGIGGNGTGSLTFYVSAPTDTLTLESDLLATTTGGITKSGLGTLVLAGNNQQLGATTINEGTLQLLGSGRLSGSNASTQIIIRQAGTLDLNGVDTGNAIDDFTNNGQIINTSATPVTLTVGNANGGGTSRGSILETNGRISVTKVGTGAQTWYGTSDYTGPTSITGNLVTVRTMADIGVASGIGKGDAADNAGSLVFGTGGGLVYTGLLENGTIAVGTTSASTNRLFTMSGANATLSSTAANNNAIVWSNTGAIVHDGVGPRTLTLTGSSQGDNILNPQITDSGAGADITSVVKTGTGMWKLGNSNNTYTGSTTITQGILMAVDGEGLPTASNLVFDGGTLYSSGIFSRDIGTGAGEMQFAAPAANQAEFIGGFLGGDSKLTVNWSGTPVWGSTTGFLSDRDGFMLNGSQARAQGATGSIALSEVEIAGDFSLGSASAAAQTGQAWIFTQNSSTVNGANTAGLVVGQSIGGNIVPSGAYIVSINSATQFTMSANTANSGAGAGTIANGEAFANNLRPIRVDDNGNTGADFATISGNISAGDAVTGIRKLGGGYLRLTGDNTYQGETNVNQGALAVVSLGHSASPNDTPTSVGLSGMNITFDDSNAITLGNGGTGGAVLSYIGSGETSDRKIRLNSTTGSNQIHSDGTGPLILTNVANDLGLGNKTLFLRGTNPDGNMIQSVLGDHGGTLGITVDGSATWILTEANTHSGNTTSGAGALGLGHDSALGTGTLVLTNGSVFAFGADRTITNAVNHNNNTSQGFFGDYSLTFTQPLNNLVSANSVTTNNNIAAGKFLSFGGVNADAMTANRTWTIDGAGHTIIDGDFTSSTGFGVAVAKTGNGILEFRGTSSNFNQNNANLDVDRGVLRIGANEVIPDAVGSGALILSPELANGDFATLDLNGFTETVGTFTAITNGTVTIDNTSANDAVFRFGLNDSTVNFGAGVGDYTITDSGAGKLSIVKLGSTSTVFSSGLTLTYQGATAVEGGSLTIGSPVDGTSALSVTGSGSVLALTGGVTNPAAVASVTVGDGATLSLLDGAGSQMDQLTNLTLGSAMGTMSTLNLNVGDLSAPGDQLNTDLLRLLGTGTLNLFAGNQITLNLTDAGLNPNRQYVLLDASAIGGGLFGGGSPLTSISDYILGAAPGGFTSIDISTNSTTNQIILSTGDLITGKSYWNAGGLLDNWSDTANWSPDDPLTVPNEGKPGTAMAASIPGQGTDVIFIADNITGGAAITTTLEQNFKINSLTFEASTNPADTPSSVTIDPGALTTSRIEIAPQNPTDGLTVSSGGPSSVILGASVKLGADQTWEIAEAGTTVTVEGALQGEADVTKTGPGKLIYTAAADPTFNAGVTSTFTVNGGSLEIGNVGALGSVGDSNLANVVVNANGAFYYNGAASTATNLAMPITLNGGTLSAGTANQTYSGTVNVSGNSFINMAENNGPATNTARNITLSGVVSGAGSLTLDSNSTASGGNQIGGTLTINNAGSTWNGDANFNRGTLTIATAASPTAGPANVTFNQFGRLILQGVDGQTIDRAGTLTYAAGAVGELQVDNTIATASQAADFIVNQNGVVTLGSGGVGASVRFSIVDAFAKMNLTNSVVLGGDSSISVSNAANRLLTISGVVSDGGNGYGLVINDDAGGWGQTNGMVRMTGPNTFTGNVTVSSGILEFDTVTGISGGASALGNGTAISMAGGILRYIGDTTSHSTDRPITSTASFSLGANGTNGASITYTGAITQVLNNALTLTGLAGSQGFITGGLTQVGSAADVTVNAGTWTLSGATFNVADDVIVTGPDAVLNLGSTGVLAALNPAGTSSGLYARNGAVINLLADDINGAANSGGLDFILVGDATAGPAGVFNTNTFSITTPRLDVGQRNAGFIGTVNGTGTINVAGGDINLYRGEVNAKLASTGTTALEKIGPGTLTLRGDNTGLASTGNSIIYAGTLVLDYTVENNDKLRAGSALNMRGGILEVLGNNSAATSQNVNGLSLANLGYSQIQVTGGTGQEAVLNLGGITRAASAGMVRFILPSGAQSATNGITTTAAVTNGLLGTGAAYATVNDGTGTWFATANGGNVVAAVSTAANDVTTWAAGADITDETTGFTGLVRGRQINTLRFDASGGSIVNIDAGDSISLASGGILVTSNVVAGSPGIFGGRLRSGAGELLITNDSTQDFTIASQISSGARITKAGTGTLVLSNTSNVPGELQIHEGTVVIAGGNTLSDTARVFLAENRQSSLVLQSSETIGALQGGRFTTDEVLGVVDLGGFTLTINQSNNNTTANENLVYDGTFAGNGTIIKNGIDFLTVRGNNALFTGLVQVNNGRLDMQNTVGRFNNASGFVINAGAEIIARQDQSSNVNRLADSAPITLNNTAGTATVAGRNGLWIYNQNQSATRTENSGEIILGAGHNTIRLDPNQNNASTVADLIADTLSRQNRATAVVNGLNLGAETGRRGRIRFDAAGQTDLEGFEVGSGSGTGTQFRIIPFLVGQTTNGGVGNSFVTHVDGTIGLRPLATSEYVTDAAGFNALAGASTDNVRFAANPGAALTGTASAINSLVIDSGTAVTLTGPASALEITSGAFLAAGNGNHVLEGFTDVTTGGGRDYTVFTTGTGTVTLGSALTSSVPLVKSGQGTLALTSASNAFTDVYLNQGHILVNDLDKLGTGSLNFFGGGLRLDTGFADDLGGKTFNVGTGGATVDTNGNDVTATDLMISGEGTLTKTGIGTLTFAGGTATALTGQVVVTRGSVVLNQTAGVNAIGAGGVFLDSAAATGGVLMTNAVNEQIDDTARVSMINDGTNAFSNWNLAGFTETVGSLELTAVSSSSTGTKVLLNGGTLIMNGDIVFNNNRGAAGNDATYLEISGDGTAGSAGTLDLGGATRTITVETNQTTFAPGSDAGIEVAITNGGIIKEGSRTLVLSGTNTYSGPTVINEGTVSVSSGSNLGDGSATNSITIRDGATLRSTGASVTVTQDVELDGHGGNIEVTGAPTNALIYTGVVSGHDHAPLTKTGVGALALTNANVHTGGTIVSEGALIAANAAGSATGLGDVTVATGAVLGGDGFIAPAADRNVTINGQLLVGDPLAVAGTDLSLVTSGMGSVILGSSSTLTFDLWSGVGSAGPNGPSAADLLVLGGASGITLGGTLEVVNMSGSTDWMKFDEWQLFDWTALSGGVTPGTAGNEFTTITLPTLSAGLTWDTSALYTAGTITIVPEPGRVMLLGVGLFLTFFRRRRQSR